MPDEALGCCPRWQCWRSAPAAGKGSGRGEGLSCQNVAELGQRGVGQAGPMHSVEGHLGLLLERHVFIFHYYEEES